MDKNYSEWTPLKVKINNESLRPDGFYRRDIWICNMGENVGFEEDGKGSRFVRPVLVIRNYGNRMCFVVPLSSTTKRSFFYHPFDGNTGRISVALLSQARVIDSSRLRRKIGIASKEDFATIQNRLAEVLGLIE